MIISYHKLYMNYLRGLLICKFFCLLFDLKRPNWQNLIFKYISIVHMIWCLFWMFFCLISLVFMFPNTELLYSFLVDDNFLLLTLLSSCLCWEKRTRHLPYNLKKKQKITLKCKLNLIRWKTAWSHLKTQTPKSSSKFFFGC